MLDSSGDGTKEVAMVVIAIMVVGGILLATVFAVVVLRAWGEDVQRTEEELHAPGVRTVTYAVPPGRDPAVLRAVLAQAGYRAIEEDATTLLVACPREDDPAKVLSLLESA
jgi:hypothetical protein